MSAPHAPQSGVCYDRPRAISSTSFSSETTPSACSFLSGSRKPDVYSSRKRLDVVFEHGSSLFCRVSWATVRFRFRPRRRDGSATPIRKRANCRPYAPLSTRLWWLAQELRPEKTTDGSTAAESIGRPVEKRQPTKKFAFSRQPITIRKTNVIETRFCEASSTCCRHNTRMAVGPKHFPNRRNTRNTSRSTIMP